MRGPSTQHAVWHGRRQLREWNGIVLWSKQLKCSKIRLVWHEIIFMFSSSLFQFRKHFTWYLLNSWLLLFIWYKNVVSFYQHEACNSRMRSKMSYLHSVTRLGEEGTFSKHQSWRLMLEPRPGFFPLWTSHFLQPAAPRAIISLNRHTNILHAATRTHPSTTDISKLTLNCKYWVNWGHVRLCVFSFYRKMFLFLRKVNRFMSRWNPECCFLLQEDTDYHNLE